MKRIILLAGFLILIIGSKSVITGNGTKKNNKDLQFYVSTDGNDSNPGTLKKPFATLTKARDEVRRIKNSGQKGNIIVWIGCGVYNLTETGVFGLDDGGSKNQLITYSAYPGEEPIFSSGKKIQGWKKMSVPPEGLPEISASHVWVAPVPEAKAGTWRFRSLYDGMVRLPRARLAVFKPVQD